MKKNVIRLTESELKNYIRKVISEQTAQPTVDLNKIKAEIVGKSVQLFLDAASTQKSTMVQIKDASVLSTGALSLSVLDLSFVTDYGKEIAVGPGKTKTTTINFSCQRRDLLTRSMVDSENKPEGGVVYNKSFQTKLTELMGCPAPINRTADFVASAASQKPADFA
jgi:hypothetical protein